MEVIGKRCSASRGNPVGCLWPQRDERFFTGDVGTLLEFAQVQVQAAIDSLEPLLQGREIERAVHLQRRHDAQPDGPMHGGVEAVEINGSHLESFWRWIFRTCQA